MITLQEPYDTRPVRFLELHEASGWRIKVYGITYRGDLPRPDLVATGKALLLPHLPPPSSTVYGVGFIGIHQGRGADFVFIGWWANENELFFHVYVAPHTAPDRWEHVNASGPLACTWDLAVIWHERSAWVETVLANPAGPDVEAYLARRLNADV